MNIPGLGSIVPLSAGIAGTDRAAITAKAAQPAAQGGAHNGGVPAIEAVVRVGHADLLGESGADGRQLLDSFEQPSDDSAADADSDAQPDSPPAVDPCIHSEPLQSQPPTLGGHIDLIG